MSRKCRAVAEIIDPRAFVSPGALIGDDDYDQGYARHAALQKANEIMKLLGIDDPPNFIERVEEAEESQNDEIRRRRR